MMTVAPKKSKHALLDVNAEFSIFEREQTHQGNTKDLHRVLSKGIREQNSDGAG